MPTHQHPIIRWVATDVRTRDYWRRPNDDCCSELEAALIGRIEPGCTALSVKEVHESLNNILLGHGPMQIKKVIFNPPATIVLWEDGEKTVVKIQNGEVYDPEKGLAMAIAKRALGNEGNYFNHIKKWTDKYYEEHSDVQEFEILIDPKDFAKTLRQTPGQVSITFDDIDIKRVR